MLGRRIKWTLFRELQDLAMSAKIEKFDSLPINIFGLKKRKGGRQKSNTKGDASILALTMSGLELKDPHKDPQKENKLKSSDSSSFNSCCRVCGMHNHFTSICLHKKEGCWRYRNKHVLCDCQILYIKSKKEIKEEKEKGEAKEKSEKAEKGNSQEKERSLLLVVIMYKEGCSIPNELTYLVKLQSSFYH